MHVPVVLPLALVVIAFMALACTDGAAEPVAGPPSRQANQPEVQENPETAPTVTVEATHPVTPPRQQQSEAVTASEPSPASEPASCQLVQGDPGQPGEVDLHVEVIADGLEIPWGLAILPSGDLLVTERPGRLRLIQDGEVIPEPFWSSACRCRPRCMA